MPETALLVLSRALGAPRIACTDAAATTGVTGLRASQVAAILLVRERGPQRMLDLGVLLGRMAGQPVVDAYRRLGLMTLTGRGRASRLSLTRSGEELASAFATVLDRLWTRATRDLPRPQLSAVADLLGAISGTPTETAKPSGFPVELIVVLDHLVARMVEDILVFADHPGLRDAALRPLLVLANGPSSPAILGSELGVGAPAVNVALRTRIGPIWSSGTRGACGSRTAASRSRDVSGWRRTPSGWTLNMPVVHRSDRQPRCC